MRLFPAPSGSGTLFFDNLIAPDGLAVAYDPATGGFVATPPFCVNRDIIGCNWAAPADGAFCEACAMTALAPDTSMPRALENWAKTEAAKRWVLANLRRWGWFGPLDRGARPVFHMLAEGVTPVVMGHADGVVSLSIEEADPVLQINRREALGERYRTMIGHIRHEIAHVLWWRLGLRQDFLDDFRSLFGDERSDYGAALEQHYRDGPPTDWQDGYLSPYATAHPHEDWAETAAHLLHLVEITDSAVATGLSGAALPGDDWMPYAEADPERLLDVAATLTLAINHVNRSMGLPDLYPFVLSDLARRKLAFAHAWLS
ncbi:MAG: putative zinc-binding metallopeptidase, partial [Pseudomonadota bacterium]